MSNMNKFVLAGLWEDGSTVYYAGGLLGEKWFQGMKVRTLTTSLDTATYFSSKDLASKELEELHDPILKVMQVCPECGKAFSGYPAISRKDNETEICPDCGTSEALHDFIQNKGE